MGCSLEAQIRGQVEVHCVQGGSGGESFDRPTNPWPAALGPPRDRTAPVEVDAEAFPS